MTAPVRTQEASAQSVTAGVEGVLKSMGHAIDDDARLRIQTFVESLPNQYSLHSLDHVLEWFEKKRRECRMDVQYVGLESLAPEWRMDETSGTLRHRTGKFYCVMGVRVSSAQDREVAAWSQPLLHQYEGGILGILCKKINGVTHYLLQAKAEPGNVGKVLLSPTLQATWSNLKQHHGGKKTLFAEYFEDPKPGSVVYSRAFAEDGGRLYLKSNQNIIVEAGENELLDIPDNFIWVTLYQVKKLLQYDNLVNPHVRSIISYL